MGNDDVHWCQYELVLIQNPNHTVLESSVIRSIQASGGVPTVPVAWGWVRVRVSPKQAPQNYAGLFLILCGDFRQIMRRIVQYYAGLHNISQVLKLKTNVLWETFLWNRISPMRRAFYLANEPRYILWNTECGFPGIPWYRLRKWGGGIS